MLSIIKDLISKSPLIRFIRFKSATPKSRLKGCGRFNQSITIYWISPINYFKNWLLYCFRINVKAPYRASRKRWLWFHSLIKSEDFCGAFGFYMFFDHRFWPIGWFVCYHVIHMWILKGLLPLFHLATGSGFSLILIAVASSILSYTLF